MDDFAAAYGRYGFQRRAFFPCYGLAEATLLVSGAEPEAGYRLLQLDRRAVEEGRIASLDDGAAPAMAVVSSGTPAARTTVVIRGDDCRALPEGSIGEICVQSPGVALGYWGDPLATAATFYASVVGHEGSFLRTGDLGALLDGQLYVVGRRRDLLIVAGRNFYPHDVESAATGIDERFPQGLGGSVPGAG